MKTRFFHLSLVIFSFVFAFGTTQAQDLSDSKNATLNYSIVFSNQVLDQLDGYKPLTTREKDAVSKFRHSIENKVRDICYEKLINAMAQEKNIRMMPLNTMEAAIDYASTGYPVVLLPKKKLKKIGGENLAEHYFSLSVYVSPNSSIGPKLLVGAVKPEVTVNIKVFDAKGNVVKKIERKTRADKNIKRIDFGTRSFNKMDLAYVDPLIEKISPTIDKAISLAVNNM